MTPRLGLFVFIVLVAVMLSVVCYAQDPDIYLAEYYRDMTSIIEQNMDNPDKCVEEVKDFFQDLDKEEYARNWVASMNKDLSEESFEESMESEPNKSMMEYNNVMASFMQKHPEHGGEIIEFSVRFMSELRSE